MAKLSYFIFVVSCLYFNFCLVNTCEIFKNVKATIYTGSDMDPIVTKLNNIDELKEAYRIEINNQNIPTLCKDGLKGLIRLDSLIIKHCKIMDLEPGAFEGLTNLRNLELSHNLITEIPKGVFNHLGVRRLNLTGNSISKINTEAFDNMAKLQLLEMDYNNIKEIDREWFKGTPKLYRLSLQNNEITELKEDSFKNIAISNDRAHELDIWLSDNKIKSIHPLAFKNFEKIETLLMSNNELTTLNDLIFEDLDMIHSLWLNDNKIKCLSDDFLRNLKVKDLDLNNNPLDCDCLKKITRWGDKKNVQTQTMRRKLDCLMNKFEDA